MKPSFFNGVNHWINRVSTHGLEAAYQAATAIKVIEDKHFDGDRITFDSTKGKTISDYFQTQLQQQLLKVKKGLAEFRIGSFLTNHQTLITANASTSIQSRETDPQPETVVLEKLAFIESIVSKYRRQPDELAEVVQTKVVPDSNSSSMTLKPVNEVVATSELPAETLDESNYRQKPRLSSLFQNLRELRRELSPEYEQRVVTELRVRRRQNKTAIRWLLLLFVIPLIVQICSKNLIFTPILNHTFDKNPSHVLVRDELQEEALKKYSFAKELLEAKQLLGLAPKMSPIQEQQARKEMVEDLYQEAGYEQQNGLANLLADVIALVVFAILAYTHRSQLLLIKSLFNRTFQSFSDPIKVFIFILITDMFVGFHSAEGWDVILQGASQHFGMPENHAAIGLFIATVPVAIDSCLKFWIFSYLTGSSPASVAILEKMN
ncbi:hypothetical protein [Nostoc sp.]|uniref:hypothetical protein n=1 Tax=Nostoc sp. TaxID=1180 RepID=UPI002FF6CCC0